MGKTEHESGIYNRLTLTVAVVSHRVVGQIAGVGENICVGGLYKLEADNLILLVLSIILDLNDDSERLGVDADNGLF